MRRPLVTALLVSLLLAGCGALPGPFGAPRGTGAVEGSRLTAPTLGAENFRQVDKDLYRSGVPSDDDMAAFARLGIKTDITLQFTGGSEAPVVKHEKKVAKDLGIKFVHLPLPWGKQPPRAMITKFLAVFKDPKNLPAIVHCKRGRDRTGAMVGLYRIVENGWTNEKAFKEMESFGFVKADYPHYAEFVLGYGKPAEDAKRQREEALPVAVPAFGGWDRE